MTRPTPEPELALSNPRQVVRAAPVGWVRLAIPVWNGHVSPVFDCAEQLLVVDFRQRRETARRVILIAETHPAQRATRLAQLGVHWLLCGAVTRPLEDLLATSGVHVCSRLRGAVDEVLSAFLRGTLDQHRFCLPGCCRGHRRRVRPCGRRPSAPNS